jgi:hypothetical protein
MICLISAISATERDGTWLKRCRGSCVAHSNSSSSSDTLRCVFLRGAALVIWRVYDRWGPHVGGMYGRWGQVDGRTQVPRFRGKTAGGRTCQRQTTIGDRDFIRWNNSGSNPGQPKRPQGRSFPCGFCIIYMIEKSLNRMYSSHFPAITKQVRIAKKDSFFVHMIAVPTAHLSLQSPL